MFQTWLARPGASFTAGGRGRILSRTPPWVYDAKPSQRARGVDVVSGFHKLLSLHVKSRRRVSAPSGMNHWRPLLCTLSWFLTCPRHLRQSCNICPQSLEALFFPSGVCAQDQRAWGVYGLVGFFWGFFNRKYLLSSRVWMGMWWWGVTLACLPSPWSMPSTQMQASTSAQPAAPSERTSNLRTWRSTVSIVLSDDPRYHPMFPMNPFFHFLTRRSQNPRRCCGLHLGGKQREHQLWGSGSPQRRVHSVAERRAAAPQRQHHQR